MPKYIKKRILLFLETSRTYGRQIIDGISRYAFETGDWVLFVEDRGLGEQEPLWLRKFKPDGIIARTTTYESYWRFQNMDVPVVELHGYDRDYAHEVRVSPTSVARMAVSHFSERGLKYHGYFSIGASWWSLDFMSAWQETLQRKTGPRNGKNEVENVFIAPSSLEKNVPTLPLLIDGQDEKKLIQWLKRLPTPIGIFCPSDSHALYLMNLCQLLGICVPNEICILGVENNAVLCNASMPSLSSIDANGEETGYQAADLLQKKMLDQPLPKLPLETRAKCVVARGSSDVTAVEDVPMLKVLQFIRDNAHFRITISDIAKEMAMGKRTLNRRFQAAFGCTMADEIRKTQMTRAKTLLLESSLTITEIGHNVGYLTPEYFIRTFKKENGATPRSFRENARRRFSE